MRKKSEVIDALADATGLTKSTVEAVLNAHRDLAHNALQREGEFQIHDIAILSTTVRQARTGRNPQTGRPLEIPASKGVRFRLAATLKRAINEV